MKKRLLTLTLGVISALGFSQIYSDNFSDQINKVSSTTGLASTESGDALKIVGDGTSAQWTPIVYSFNNSGTDANVNVSSTPKLFIKVKSTIPAELRLDLRDSNGYTSNYNPSTINIGTDYQVFEIDYFQKLEDGGYGGPCASTSAPCAVDATMLKNMLIYVNASTGGFNGTIDIDWISFGTSLASSFDIRYNQVGYFPDRDKYISVLSSETFAPQSFLVLDANDNTVLTGTTTASAQWVSYDNILLLDKYIASADVTNITTSGTYKFRIGDSEISFKVGQDIYKTLSDDVLHYYYLARCSTDITPEYGGVYARAMGINDTNVIVGANAGTIGSTELTAGDVLEDVTKGWYDAADYNKYMVNSGISTYTLLATYERFKDLYKAKSMNIPEKGGYLPDILDEIKWNLDWMEKMQAADGSVAHKLSGKRFAPQVMPDQYHAKLAELGIDNRRFILGRTTAAALNFSAVMATASRLYKEFDLEYSNRILEKAKMAFNWATNNEIWYYGDPNSDEYKNASAYVIAHTQIDPNGFSTGTYDDLGDMSQEFTWAAVELFLSTQDDSYLSDSHVNLTKLASNGNMPTWSNPGPLALFSITMNKDIAATSSVLGNISQYTNRIISTAAGHKYLASKSPMKFSLGNGTYDFYWGSTANAAKYAMYLITAYEETQDEAYLNEAYKEMDYIMGRNGTGYSYITGHGDNPSKFPHHRPSTNDGITAPWPGMLVGGPNTNVSLEKTGDLTSCYDYKTDKYPAENYIDATCSYSANEVAINWNAPLVFVVNALQNYETPEQTLDTAEESVKETIKHDVIAYPNPTGGVVNLKASKDLKIKTVVVYNASGQLVKSSDTDSVDLSGQPSGVYYLRISTDDEIFNQKVIKK